MALKDGSLASLMNQGCSTPLLDLARTILHHMLKALDCLTVKGLVHRDLKPENILYSWSPEDGYTFLLGDFGLSNRAALAQTFSGSPLYMAPEMFSRGEQTHKVDVWSLHVTMMWTLDEGGFRQKSHSFRSSEEVQREVLHAAKSHPKIAEMVRINPEERASAAQMLVKWFSGEGLMTPLDQVPPLDRPAEQNDLASTLASAARNRLRQRFRGSGRMGVVATRQFRVGKNRASPQGRWRPGDNVSAELAGKARKTLRSKPEGQGKGQLVLSASAMDISPAASTSMFGLSG